VSQTKIPINSIAVLDKGYVALHSSSPSNEQLKQIRYNFLRGQLTDQLLVSSYLTVQIKCPLFVQLNLANHLLHIITNKSRQNVSAYITDIGDIGARDLQTSKEILSNIEQTTEALLLNPRAYQSDGCDLFIAQILAPISVYNECLVSGTLQQWLLFINQPHLPAPINEYRKAIKDIIWAEWSEIEELLERHVNG
jgi:hypothetical protein